MRGHPYDCTEQTNPARCRYCGQTVIYWECLHGSKVFFDPPDGGDHRYNCSAMSGASAKPSPPRASGKTALRTLSGVSLSVQPDDYGLMPGAKRVFDNSVRRPRLSMRQIVAMRIHAPKSPSLSKSAHPAILAQPRQRRSTTHRRWNRESALPLPTPHDSSSSPRLLSGRPVPAYPPSAHIRPSLGCPTSFFTKLRPSRPGYSGVNAPQASAPACPRWWLATFLPASYPDPPRLWFSRSGCL